MEVAEIQRVALIEATLNLRQTRNSGLRLAQTCLRPRLREPKADAIAMLRRGGVDADFLCFSSGSTPQPPSLPRILRDRAAALGIEIVIDHYSGGLADCITTR